MITLTLNTLDLSLRRGLREILFTPGLISRSVSATPAGEKDVVAAPVRSLACSQCRGHPVALTLGTPNGLHEIDSLVALGSGGSSVRRCRRDSDDATTSPS